MPTYINPHKTPINIAFTYEGKRGGGTIYPASWPAKRGALQEMEIPASKAAEYVRTGMLILRDPYNPPAPTKTDPVDHAADPQPTEAEDLSVDPEEITAEDVAEAAAPTVEIDVEAERKAAKKAKFLADLARGRENARKLREAEAAVKAEAERKSASNDHEDDETCEDEDSGDELDDTAELPAPVDPEEAEKVAKEETVKIANPIIKKRRFVVRDED